MSDITWQELMELYQLRKGKEPTRALERRRYADPQTNVEYQAEIAKRARSKKLKGKGRR